MVDNFSRTYYWFEHKSSGGMNFGSLEWSRRRKWRIIITNDYLGRNGWYDVHYGWPMTTGAGLFNCFPWPGSEAYQGRTGQGSRGWRRLLQGVFVVGSAGLLTSSLRGWGCLRSWCIIRFGVRSLALVQYTVDVGESMWWCTVGARQGNLRKDTSLLQVVAAVAESP